MSLPSLSDVSGQLGVESGEVVMRESVRMRKDGKEEECGKGRGVESTGTARQGMGCDGESAQEARGARSAVVCVCNVQGEGRR